MLAIYKSNNNFFIQAHDVYKKDGQLKLGEGVSLSDDTWSKIAKTALSKKKSDDIIFSGIMPENILFFKNTIAEKKLIWWEPAQKRYIHFVKDLHIPSGEAPVPSLIFKYCNERLSVYATNLLRRPVEETKLFSPPFHNCSQTGEVCMGSAETKKTLIAQNIITEWSKAFWQSEFTHTNNEKNVKGNINSMWKILIQEKRPLFPTDVLAPLKLTLKDLLK